MKQKLLLAICGLFLLQEPMLAQVQVWPGDANNNGIVNRNDLLYLGLSYNFFGPQRTTTDTDWSAQNAAAWNLSAADGTNLVHADCNGDGLINFFYDAFPIYVHYGNTHGTSNPETYTAGVAGVDPQLYLEPVNNQAAYELGSNLLVNINLGTDSLPIEDFYGISFSVLVDSQAVNVDDIQFNFTETSWANPDMDRIFMTHRGSNSHVDVSWVRTDRNNRSGFGSFGTVNFVIVDNVVMLQKSEFQITIDSIRMIDRNGNTTTVAGSTRTIPVIPNALASENPVKSPKLTIAPNPAQGILRIEAAQAIQMLLLHDALGQTVAQLQPKSNQITWALPNLPTGVYYCHAQMENGQLTRHKILID